MARYAFRNGPFSRAVGPPMEPATEYLRFAEECRRLAPFAKTEQHRQVLKEMAQAWENLAKEAEQKSSHSPA
jgi:hypothetical protein